MQFKSAAEYRRHLREIIPDAKLVEQCVAAKFRPAAKPIGHAKFHDIGHSKPSETDGDYFAGTDRRHRELMAAANDRFVRAIYGELNDIKRRRRQTQARG